jgi:hypothetical protein
MYTRLFFVLVSIFTLAACQQEAPPKFTEEELTQQDQNWAKMMLIHDEVMPLMTPISQVATQIEAIAEENQTAANAVHTKAMYHLEQLETSSDAMMEWMAGISDNPLDSLRTRYADHAAVMAAIDKEFTTITQVEHQMNTSLTEAKQFVTAMEYESMPKPE